MKFTKYILTLAASLLLIFACADPVIVEGSGLSAKGDSVSPVVTNGDTVELVVGLKATDRAISRVVAEVEASVNEVLLSTSRGSAVSLKRVHDVVALTGDTPAGSRASREAIIQNAYDSLTTDVERALYRDFTFTVDKELAAQVMQELAARADIDYVQENYLYEQLFEPNDPAYVEGKLYGVKTTFTDKAWSITQGSSGVVVAVLDSGVEATHPDLAANIWRAADGTFGYDFSDNDNDPSPDYQSHGTHVAGTIAAVGNNGIGLIGVAPGVKIMSVKLFPNALSTVCAQGIRYAVDNGAKVLNNSWGSRYRNPSDPTVEKAIEYAHAKGAVIIFAAGNSNDDATYYYGANSPLTIAVASVDQFNKKSSFSNYGKVVDVAAPGSSIYSTVLRGDYWTKSGTSMAAPHVAGLAALILSKFPHYSNERVREVIKSTATPLTVTNLGAGVMNSYKALGGTGNFTDTFPPSPTGRVTVDVVTATTASLSWLASTDNVGVTGYKIYKNNVYSETVGSNVAVIKGLQPNTSYSIAISAIDAAGNESDKRYATVKTALSGGGDSVAPTKPANFKAGTVTSNTVSLSWSASTDNVGVKGYRVYSNGVLSSSVTGTSTVLSALTANTAYKLELAAFDAAGNESAKALVNVITKAEGSGGAPEWKVGVAYAKGDLVSFNGATYECIGAHTSITGWTPLAVPALWKQI